MSESALISFSVWLVAAEALAAIAGFITYKKWRRCYLRWFPFYVTLIVMFEAGYYLFRYFGNNTASILMYEIAIPLEMIFINWFFYHTLKKNKKLIVAGSIIYIIVWLLEKTIFTESDYYFQSLSYTAGNLFILVYLILFFIQLIRSEKLLNFKKLTVFWIALGMLVFYLGTFPFYGLYNELAKNLNIFIPVAWVATSLNYCMYLLFTFGLIWGKPH
jgi:hypothetical protein